MKNNIDKSINMHVNIELQIGQSIEEKTRELEKTNQPIEAISPMLYTERKEGVRPEYNIRTDKFDVALQAMTTIAEGRRSKRTERIKAEAEAIKGQQPDGKAV